MTRITFLIALIVSFASVVNAQPPRPVEQPRSVTLTLAEYNRLLDRATLVGTPVERSTGFFAPLLQSF